MDHLNAGKPHELLEVEMAGSAFAWRADPDLAGFCLGVSHQVLRRLVL
jgi:hypothetical protein